MKNLPSPILTNLLEVINEAGESLDCDFIRRKVLDTLFYTIFSEGALFLLPSGNPVSTYVILKNLDPTYNDHYVKYYHRFDNLYKAASLTNFEIAAIHSYDSFKPAEYYHDFLEPQRIHHKLIIELVAEQKLHGRIVLTRSQKSNLFTEEELRLANTIAPYLAHALAHFDLRRRVKLRGHILNFIQEQSSNGLILLDEHFQVVRMNSKADEILGSLIHSGTGIHAKDPIFSQLMDDSLEIKASLKRLPAEGMVIPKTYVVKGADNTRFSVTLKAFDQKMAWDGSLMFMVCIEKLPPPASVDPQYLIDLYHLSKREAEVTVLLFSGLKNVEIAKKLFISEITVKKHLQKIYEKVGVNNRTSLINMILTREAVGGDTQSFGGRLDYQRASAMNPSGIKYTFV
ncbi:MAG: LuxR C-terminal-related transcriptional regulator [Pseudomonadota bacterium]